MLLPGPLSRYLHGKRVANGQSSTGGTDVGGTNDASGSSGSDSDESAGSDSSDVLFPWVDHGDVGDNWLEGLGLAGLGAIGGLVMAYLLLGQFLPSMGGKAEYDALIIQIKDLADRRDKQLASRESYTRGNGEMDKEHRDEAERLTADFNNIIAGKEDAAGRLRRSMLAVGFPLYVILGGAFAVLFASNALQALLIGFGWTAIADRVGLKREVDAKNKTRDESIATLEKEAEATEKAEAKLAAAETDLKKAKQTAATAIAAVAPALESEPPPSHEAPPTNE